MTVSTPTRHAPACASGKGWPTQEAAASSGRGRDPGAEVFKCPDGECPLWHVRSPSRDRLLTFADYALHGASCVAKDAGDDDAGATAVNDEIALGAVFGAIKTADTDEEAFAVLLEVIRGLAGLAPREEVAAGEAGFPQRVQLLVRSRAGTCDPDMARCEACGVWLGRYGGQVQARLAHRRTDGKDLVISGTANAALLCGNRLLGCCSKVQARDQEMEARGWFIREGGTAGHDPRYVPVMLFNPDSSSGVRMWLREGGTYSTEPPNVLEASGWGAS